MYTNRGLGLSYDTAAPFPPTADAAIVSAGAAALLAAVDSTGALPGNELGELWVARWIGENVGPEYAATYGTQILQEFARQWAEGHPQQVTEQPAAIEVDLIVEPNPNGVPGLWNVLAHRGHFVYADGREAYSSWGQPGVFYNLSTAEVTPGSPWSRSTWLGTVGHVWPYDAIPSSELERQPDYPFPGEAVVTALTAPPEPTAPIPPATVTLPTGETVPIEQAPAGTFGPAPITPVTEPAPVLYPSTTPALPPSSAIPATAAPAPGAPVYTVPGAFPVPGGGYPTPEMPAAAPAAPVQEAGIGRGLLIGGGILAVVLLLGGRRRRGPRIKGYRRY